MNKNIDIEKLNGKIIICSYKGKDTYYLILHEEENPDVFFMDKIVRNNDYSFLVLDMSRKEKCHISRSEKCVKALLTKGIYYYKIESNDPDDDMVDELI